MNAAIVTGSAGAIGSSMVEALSGAGYFVVGVDRVETHGADESVVFDLATLPQRRSAVSTLRKRLLSAVGDRNLKALVNNAAVQILGPVDRLSVDDFRTSLDVNVTAAYALVQICLDRLSAARGSIVNIGSIHARLTKRHFCAYAASKGAIESLTRALAVEIGDRVKVNAISPAAIDTPMLRAGFDNATNSLRALAKQHPTQTIGYPDEVARLLLFIVDEAAPFLNGAVVELSGGIGARLHDPS